MKKDERTTMQIIIHEYLAPTVFVLSASATIAFAWELKHYLIPLFAILLIVAMFWSLFD